MYAIVLGLGGWLLGALIVLTTMSGVPLDHELLAVLGVGVPVGLGIYLAWVPRDSSATTKTAGFVAALAGALAGAYLGFHATTDLLALVTAIVGAVAGANLTLILFDMARAESEVTVDGEPPEPRAGSAYRRSKPLSRHGVVERALARGPLDHALA